MEEVVRKLPVDQRLSMVMLGVDDLERCRRFYEGGLGWTPWGARQSRTSVKYLNGGVVLAMIDRRYLAAESGLPPGSGSVGIVLVINVSSRTEVDAAADAVSRAGGIISSAARLRDGGLYSCYFTDPDDNPWEVVWNPHMLMDANGVLQAPS
jgi:predicted lactoylglutathione lyase